jgi:DNA-binding winged helix-turn-helix (wHTH) protein
MIYRFADFELDPSTAELRRGEQAVTVEPQVFALVLLLVENRERVVSRDEILERVWDGRVVSDSALSSRIKSARRALGDDGRAQRFIRTIHGRGFRFVAEVKEAAAVRRRPHAVDASAERVAAPPGGVGRDAKPSIAVLPFRLVGAAGPHAAIADALPHEMIAELARLRWLFVVARGSSFRFRSATPAFEDVGKLLGVRYCLWGVMELSGKSLTVTVQLVDTADSGVVWAERFHSHLADVHVTRAAILSRLVAALEIQIPLHEAHLARLTVPENLDAWSAYHLGLQHMFRFNKADNAAAGQLFERATQLDRGFARAFAGRSFVHFQNAFLRYTPDPEGDVQLARRCAERGIEFDALDPFVNFTMGRCFWLEGDIDGSWTWLDRATSISPNYAQGIYARAWAHALSGRGTEGRQDADLAMALSPLDPLHYAMKATRALSHLVCNEDAEAAAWAERAARSPGAHVLIAVIAIAAHALNGDRARASAWATNVRQRRPDLTQADFFRSFPFPDPRFRQRVAGALARSGL